MTEITKEEAESLLDFIESNFFDAIRNDVDIDNLPDEIYHGEIIINVYSTSSVSI